MAISKGRMKMHLGRAVARGTVLFLLLFAGFPTPPSAVRAASSTLSASQDTYLDQNSPGSTFGSSTDLKVRSETSSKNQRVLIEFNLSGIPGGAFIESATLRIFMFDATNSSRTYQVYRITDSWAEGTATWTNAAADYNGTVIASQTTGTTNNVWLEFDVASLVQAWVDGTYSHYGFLIRDSVESSLTAYDALFRSSEYSSNQPQLVVVWDTTPPSDPTNLTSPSHTTNVWSSDNTVDVTWTAATDNIGGSGVDGYSIVWNTTPSTVPDNTLELQETDTSTTSPSLADGNSHYFHIRTCDNGGNCTSTLHLGPFFIDTTAPGDPTNLTSPSHTTSEWSSDNTVDVGWTAATDPGGSGVDGYSIEWSTSASTIPDAVKDLEESATTTTSPSLADGNSHYFHIRTCDNVGNCTSTLHLGPFFIDASAPSDPTNLTSTSHTTSVWSNDNTVDVSWTAATDPGGSGIDGYSFEWDSSASTIPDTVKDLEESATSITSPSLADGNSHYFHIRTCDNVGNCTSTLHLGPFFIDITDPNDPTNMTSSSHTVSLWSSDNTVSVTWTASIDSGGSGIDGYSIVWDTNSNTLPNTTLELQEGAVSTTSPALADGTSHYFHLRTCDNAGNCTSTLHIGPFWIDTTSPFVSHRQPAPGTDGVSPYTDIFLRVRDNGIGVKKSSIVMKVNGTEVTPVITGSAETYELAYNPGVFAYGQEVKVIVQAEDKLVNSMPTVKYSFWIQFAPGSQSTPTPTSTSTATPTPTSTATATPTRTPAPTTAATGSSAASGECENGFLYTVQSGEWIYALARRFGVTPQAILAANDLADPSNLRPGQQLCIPGSGTTPTPTETPTPTSSATPTPTPSLTATPTFIPSPTPLPEDNGGQSGSTSGPLDFLLFALGQIPFWLWLLLAFIAGVLLTSGFYNWRTRQV